MQACRKHTLRCDFLSLPVDMPDQPGELGRDYPNRGVAHISDREEAA